LVVHPSLPVTSVPELITYAKSNPGKLTIASAGIGSAPHMYWDPGCLAGKPLHLCRCRSGFRSVRFPAVKRNRKLGGCGEAGFESRLRPNIVVDLRPRTTLNRELVR